jgi:hypothetical protein
VKSAYRGKVGRKLLPKKKDDGKELKREFVRACNYCTATGNLHHDIL